MIDAALALAMDLSSLVLAVISGLGLLGGIGLGVKAIVERRNLNAQANANDAKAGSDHANAASIVAAAARELVDPLRRELATERAENALELAAMREENAVNLAREREKVALLQGELDQALSEVASLRLALQEMMAEVELVTGRLAEKEEQILQYEKEITRLKQERGDGLANGPHSP